MHDHNIKKLAMAVVLQAVHDWNKFCKKPSKQTVFNNFTELERFFREDADTYLIGSSLTGDKILKKLQLKRAESMARR